MSEPTAGPHAIDSPCIDVCELGAGDICVGCFRTLEEIGAWSMLDDDGKRRVLEAALARRRDHFNRPASDASATSSALIPSHSRSTLSLSSPTSRTRR